MQSKRRFLVTCALAALAAAAFLPGSGLGSRATAVRGRRAAIPAALAKAIHARFGGAAIRSSAVGSPTIDPLLGLSVALSADGTTALVGAPGVGNGKGAAYIFHSAAAGSWSSKSVPTATLTSKHSSAQGLFGLAVALSADGTTAFVSAPLAGGMLGAGAIYAFHTSGEDAWASTSTPKATLTVPSGIFVGWALALSPDGTTLLVGAPFYNLVSGGAYVFHASSESAWASTSTPAATLSNASENPNDSGVGATVAISGDGTTALLGDSGNPNGGGAYVYHVSAADAWAPSTTPTAILSNAVSAADDALGAAVALSADGTLALLGAPGAGSADVFHSSAADAWATTSTPTATLTKAGGWPTDNFGVNVTVSGDGTTAFVFAPGVSSSRGAAYVFDASDEGAWADNSAPTATLTVSGGHAGDNFGIGVLSSDGATLLAGAPGVKLQSGAAYVRHVADESSWVTSSTSGATLTNKALEACVVPKLKGLKVRDAKSALAVGRCRLGKVSKVHAKSKKGHGRVLSQKFKPGKRLAIHAKVSVKVGK